MGTSKRVYILLLGAAVVSGGAWVSRGLWSPASTGEVSPVAAAATRAEAANASAQPPRPAVAVRLTAPAAVSAMGVAEAPVPSALEPLRAAFERSSDLEGVLVGAARMGTPEAARWLAEVAAKDARFGARAGAALGQVVDRRAGPALLELATGEGPVIVRANAARALGAAGSGEQALGLADLAEDAGQPLRVRQEAALALAKLKDASVVPALVYALERALTERGTEAEQLRISLVQALGAIGSPEAKAALQAHAHRDLSAVERAFVQQAVAMGGAAR